MAVEILNIDDDPSVSIAVRAMLKMQGYTVHSAYSGEEGLEICKEKMPSLVLLDVGLPGIDGFETLRQIKLLDDGIPADAQFLQKPFTGIDLLIKVRHVLTGHR